MRHLLIAQDVILTAAHCFDKKRSSDTEFAIYQRDESGVKRFFSNFSGKEVFSHPDYDAFSFANDIAVIKLCGENDKANNRNLPKHEIINISEEVFDHPQWAKLGESL